MFEQISRLDSELAAQASPIRPNNKRFSGSEMANLNNNPLYHDDSMFIQTETQFQQQQTAKKKQKKSYNIDLRKIPGTTLSALSHHYRQIH